VAKKTEHRLHHGSGGAAISVRVNQTKGQNRVVQILDNGTLEIDLTAPLKDGQTNQDLLKFLSQVLQVPAAQFEVIAGSEAKDKLITILDIEASDLQDRITKILK
jgi:uncharacterized protein (TIGR00251 family)